MFDLRDPFFQGPEVSVCDAGFERDSPQEKERLAPLWIRLAAIRRRCAASIVIGWLCGVVVTLSGCGGAAFIGTSSSVATASKLEVSPGAVAFGNVNVGQAASANISLSNSGSAPIQISQLLVSGQSFTVTSQTSLPLTIPGGGAYNLTVQFDPSATGEAAGQLKISGNSSTYSNVIDLSGTGVAGGSTPSTSDSALSELSCMRGSVTGVANDACTVTLTAPTGAGGLKVNLASKNAAVIVPAAVTVPAGSTSAGFMATVSAVTASENATLTASAGGTTATYALTLNAVTAGLALSASDLAFGGVMVNAEKTLTVILTASGTAPVTVSAATITGTGFSMSGVNFPLLLNPGRTATLSIKFDPAAAGATTGVITLTSNAAGARTATIGLSGTGDTAPGELSRLSCTKGSMTGAASDGCTVGLTAAAGASGLTVSLASNNAAVIMPAAVIVPAGSTSASFAATVAAVTAAKTATLTASAGGVIKTFALQLNAAVPTLSIDSTNLAFGDVVVNTPATQSVTLTSSGATAVTISAITISGKGFSISGAGLPLTLIPNQTVTLQIEFDPTITGPAMGQLTIVSNSLTNPIALISLSGTGAATSVDVQLSWNAPKNSSDPVVGYDVYRVTNGSSSYQRLNSKVDGSTNYTDSTVVSGASYTYYVESVDNSGKTSAPSNSYTAKIP